LEAEVFYLSHKNFHFSEIFKIIDQNEDIELFEFKIINNLEVEKLYLVNVSLKKEKEKREWNWFILRDLKFKKITYHYKDLIFPETDFDKFINYIKKLTPDFLHIIFFNYIV